MREKVLISDKAGENKEIPLSANKKPLDITMIEVHKHSWISRQIREHGSTLKEALNAYKIEWLKEQGAKHGCTLAQTKAALDDYFAR